MGVRHLQGEFTFIENIKKWKYPTDDGHDCFYFAYVIGNTKWNTCTCKTNAAYFHCFFKDACPGKEHCTKYLKRKRSDEHPEIYYYKESKETIRLKAPDIQSLRNGVLVRNAKYGDGVILEILKDEMLTVQFHDKVLTFLYPSAFQDGKLRIVNQKK